ncbi:hypothetical protein BJF79_12750 [Actinomadura sp. CNU-125]|nr:hypothetical protein BJF79_12750 [Actinomadura sp. CNU-125]
MPVPGPSPAACRSAIAAAGGIVPASGPEPPPVFTTARTTVGTTATAPSAEIAMMRSVLRFTDPIQHQVPRR